MTGIQFLLREMKELKYSHSLESHSALIILAMLQKNTEHMEALWSQMLAEKFEPSAALLLHKLTYYCRYTEDIDSVVRVYDDIVKCVFFFHEFILRNWRIVKVATTKAQRKLLFGTRFVNTR